MLDEKTKSADLIEGVPSSEITSEDSGFDSILQDIAQFYEEEKQEYLDYQRYGYEKGEEVFRSLPLKQKILSYIQSKPKAFVNLIWGTSKEVSYHAIFALFLREDEASRDLQKAFLSQLFLFPQKNILFVLKAWNEESYQKLIALITKEITHISWRERRQWKIFISRFDEKDSLIDSEDQLYTPEIIFDKDEEIPLACLVFPFLNSKQIDSLFERLIEKVNKNERDLFVYLALASLIPSLLSMEQCFSLMMSLIKNAEMNALSYSFYNEEYSVFLYALIKRLNHIKQKDLSNDAIAEIYERFSRFPFYALCGLDQNRFKKACEQIEVSFLRFPEKQKKEFIALILSDSRYDAVLGGLINLIQKFFKRLGKKEKRFLVASHLRKLIDKNKRYFENEMVFIDRIFISNFNLIRKEFFKIIVDSVAFEGLIGVLNFFFKKMRAIEKKQFIMPFFRALEARNLRMPREIVLKIKSFFETLSRDELKPFVPMLLKMLFSQNESLIKCAALTLIVEDDFLLSYEEDDKSIFNRFFRLIKEGNTSNSFYNPSQAIKEAFPIFSQKEKERFLTFVLRELDSSDDRLFSEFSEMIQVYLKGLSEETLAVFRALILNMLMYDNILCFTKLSLEAIRTILSNASPAVLKDFVNVIIKNLEARDMSQKPELLRKINQIIPSFSREMRELLITSVIDNFKHYFLVYSVKGLNLLIQVLAPFLSEAHCHRLLKLFMDLFEDNNHPKYRSMIKDLFFLEEANQIILIFSKEQRELLATSIMDNVSSYFLSGDVSHFNFMIEILDPLLSEAYCNQWIKFFMKYFESDFFMENSHMIVNAFFMRLCKLEGKDKFSHDQKRAFVDLLCYQKEREGKPIYYSRAARFFDIFNTHSKTAKLDAAKAVSCQFVNGAFNIKKLPSAAKNGRLGSIVQRLHL